MSGDNTSGVTKAWRYVPSEDSLNKAEQIAEKLGITMDREQTAVQAMDLLALYFKDLQLALPEHCAEITFEDMAHRDRIENYADGEQAKPLIRIDQHFSQWQSSLNLITIIFSCYDLPSEQLQELGNLLEKRFRQLQNPIAHQILRQEEWSWMRDFAEVMPLESVLSKAMDIFVITHEIAHHHLRHLDDEPSKAQEFEADRLGYELLIRVQEQADKLNYAKLDRKTLAGPCLCLGYLDLYERWLAKASGFKAVAEYDAHPKASERKQALLKQFSNTWDEPTWELYKAMNESLEDFSRGLGIIDIH